MTSVGPGQFWEELAALTADKVVQRINGPQPSTPLKLLSSQELSAALGVRPETLLRWVAAGCPHSRWGRRFRFVLSDVVAWRERTP